MRLRWGCLCVAFVALTACGDTDEGETNTTGTTDAAVAEDSASPPADTGTTAVSDSGPAASDAGAEDSSAPAPDATEPTPDATVEEDTGAVEDAGVPAPDATVVDATGPTPDATVVDATEPTPDATVVDATEPTPDAVVVDANEPVDPCQVCLDSGGTWQPEAEACTEACDIQDISCYVSECPAPCSVESCDTCFGQAACDEAGCGWQEGTGVDETSGPYCGPPPPPTDQCLGEADQVVHEDSEALTAARKSCGTQAIAIADPDERTAAFTECLVNATGLSSACALCYVVDAQCTLDGGCALPCLTGTDEECTECRDEAGCNESLAVCTGID